MTTRDRNAGDRPADDEQNGPATAPTPRLNDRRAIFGWCVYDWANSAYALTVLAGLLPAYFAEAIVGPEGVTWAGWTFRASSLWAAAITVASLLAFLAAPVLGAVADYSAAKKRFLLAFAYAGSVCVLLLWLVRGAGDTLLTLGLFVGAQISFVSANVFYNAFLPQLASSDRLDRVSAYGFALGYIGGATQFAIALVLVLMHETFGLDQATAVRIGLVTAGLWWGGFTLVTALLVHEPPPLYRRPDAVARRGGLAYMRIGFAHVWSTTRRVGRFRHLVLFLCAYMLYNDGIQTVLTMAAVYGKDELGLATGRLMLTLLVVQIVAMAGSLVFSRVAERLGTKRTIMLTLVLWCGVVSYAYFIDDFASFFGLGIAVGVVMGGSQALSRSFYSSIIPPDASAEFFGFYTVFDKFSAIWGPLAMFVISQLTGSIRLAIVSLIAFFVAGLVLLAFVNVDKARGARDEAAF